MSTRTRHMHIELYIHNHRGHLDKPALMLSNIRMNMFAFVLACKFACHTGTHVNCMHVLSFLNAHTMPTNVNTITRGHTYKQTWVGVNSVFTIFVSLGAHVAILVHAHSKCTF